MKILKMISIVLCLVLLIGPVLNVNGSENDLSVTSGCRTVDAASPIGGSEKLLDTSKAVIVYERRTGTLVYAYNADGKIYPSSMVKLMTALVALQEGDLDDVVTVTRSALDSVAIGSVSAGLVRDEEITLRDLLYCMMVASANDASAVIAEHIAGSQAAFVEMMNEMAANMGCTGTHFSNVTGLHDAETYTTVRDVLRILNLGLGNPEFKTMFETVNYTVPATNKSAERSIVTTNNMMNTGSKYYDQRVTGGKTGATDQAGRCLAVTADVGGMELIAVVMGAKATYEVDGLVLSSYGSFEEMAKLLDHAEETYECRQLCYEGQVVAQYGVSGGSNNVVTMPEKEVSCVLPKDVTAEELDWRYASSVSTLAAPVAQGQAITTLEIWYGNICLGQTELVAMNAVAVEEGLTEHRITEDEKKEQRHGEILALILGIILGVVVLGLLAVLLARVIQTAVLKARIRRRRRNRRRNRNARME